ncbi:MAG: hypothetical protein J6K12_01205 [Clostridia bacterium]|nr:hypothetical protein [Clostridia bacterium]
MLNNIDAVYIVIYAAIIGFAVAVIFINIQHTAISKFINGLINLKAFGEENACSLSQLGICGINAIMVKRAIKNQNGLKRVTGTKIIKEAPEDEAEILLNGNKTQYAFYLSEQEDTEIIFKKYNYKPLSAAKIAVIVVMIIITTFICSKAIDLFKSFALSSTTDENKHEENFVSESNENTAGLDNETNSILPPDNKGEGVSQDINTNEDKDNEDISKPSIPMGPQNQ